MTHSSWPFVLFEILLWLTTGKWPIFGTCSIFLNRPELAIIGCLACRTYLASLIRDIRAGVPVEQVADSANNICQLLMPFDPHVCRTLIDLNAHSLAYIILSRASLGANEVCGLILQGECGAVDPQFNFAVNVSPHNPITGPKTVSAPRTPDELRIIHISDIHYDENYLAGGISNCPNPTCCRRSAGVAPDPANRAGPWGDYNVSEIFAWLEIRLTNRVRSAIHRGKLSKIHFSGSVAHIRISIWFITLAIWWIMVYGRLLQLVIDG